MRIFFAGDGYDNYIRDQKNVLKSYFYITEKIINKFSSIYLDSGGFTAFTKNVTIKIDSYIEFIKKHEKKIKKCFVLDDIKDYKKTMKNQEYMEKNNIKPIPCWHANEPLEILEHYCSIYNYISLGGLVPFARRKETLKKILDSAWSVIKKYYPIKVHGFGMTSKGVLERYPFYSVDSTSWLEGARRGTISDIFKKDLYLENFCLMDKQNHKNYKSRTIFMRNQQLYLEKYITELWEKRGVMWDD